MHLHRLSTTVNAALNHGKLEARMLHGTMDLTDQDCSSPRMTTTEGAVRSGLLIVGEPKKSNVRLPPTEWEDRIELSSCTHTKWL